MARSNRTFLVSLATAVALALLGACGDDDDDSGGFSGEAKSTVFAPSTGGDNSSASAPSNLGGGSENPLALTLDRKIVFNAAIQLRVDDIGASFDRVTAIARAQGGFVQSSNFSRGNDDAAAREATLTVRVPAAAYDAALADLRALPGSKVDNESSKSTEVTEEYTDLQSRLRNLERSEQQYLSLLGNAKTVPDIITVNDRLETVRGQIEQIQGRLNVLNQLTDMATIDVSLAPVALAKADGKRGPQGIGETFVEAWDASVVTARYLANGAVVLGVVGIWLAVPGILVLIGARYARRRSQPSAT